VAVVAVVGAAAAIEQVDDNAALPSLLLSMHISASRGGTSFPLVLYSAAIFSLKKKQKKTFTVAAASVFGPNLSFSCRRLSSSSSSSLLGTSPSSSSSSPPYSSSSSVVASCSGRIQNLGGGGGRIADWSIRRRGGSSSPSVSGSLESAQRLSVVRPSSSLQEFNRTIFGASGSVASAAAAAAEQQIVEEVEDLVEESEAMGSLEEETFASSCCCCMPILEAGVYRFDASEAARKEAAPCLSFVNPKLREVTFSCGTANSHSNYFLTTKLEDPTFVPQFLSENGQQIVLLKVTYCIPALQFRSSHSQGFRAFQRFSRFSCVLQWLTNFTWFSLCSCHQAHHSMGQGKSVDL